MTVMAVAKHLGPHRLRGDIVGGQPALRRSLKRSHDVTDVGDQLSRVFHHSLAPNVQVGQLNVAVEKPAEAV